MNKKHLLCTSVLWLLLMPSANARTNYICRLDGKAVYTTQKINASCQVSEMDGISEETVSVNRTETPKAASFDKKSPNTVVMTTSAELYGEPSFDFIQPNENDQITKIWEKEQFGSYDDVKIMPRLEDQKPAELNVKIRNNQPFDKNGIHSGKANTRLPVNYIPAPVESSKPKLTRKQILQREIAGEQAALVRAQAMLAKARKSGGSTSELEQTVRDRLANVKAIQSELKRQ